MIPRVSVAPDRVSLRPGESTSVDVTIQNTSQAIEHYGPTVVGLPRDDLFDCEPSVVKLRPGESGTVQVNISVPERPAPDAGLYTLGVLVRSPYQRQVSRCEELRMDVTGARAAGPRGGAHGPVRAEAADPRRAAARGRHRGRGRCPRGGHARGCPDEQGQATGRPEPQGRCRGRRTASRGTAGGARCVDGAGRQDQCRAGSPAAAEGREVPGGTGEAGDRRLHPDAGRATGR